MSEFIVLVLECMGVVSFSITGVLAAVDSKLDFFGIVLVGGVTAVGGGIMRDVILGITPPLFFENIVIILIALIVPIVVFFILKIKKNIYNHKVKIEYINSFFDALGLGVFSIMGAEVASIRGHDDNLLLIIVAGMLTGIGGGMLRDIMTNNIPIVLKKYIYAIASLIGIVIFYFLKMFINNLLFSSIAGVWVIIVIRLLASKYRWKLPKIDVK